MSRCKAKRHRTMSYTEPDRVTGYDPETGAMQIEQGSLYELWAVCGKRGGHRGDHGPGWRQRLRRWWHR